MIRNQAGLGHLGPIVAFVLVFGIVAVIGYSVATKQKTASNNGDNATPPKTSQHEVTAADAPVIENTGDLDKAASALGQVRSASDASDGRQLQSQLSGLQ